MKIRNGFVSNSSSSSFCVMGILENDKTYSKIMELIDNFNLDDDISVYDTEEGVFIGTDFGLEYSNMDKTLRQIRNESFEKIKKILNINEEDVHIYYGEYFPY